MLGLLGILGALLAGLTLDSGTDAPSAGREAEDNPADDEEAWGVSTAFMLGEDPAGGDHGGTEPDGQPISNDLPDEPDPDLALHGDEWDDTLEGGSGKDQIAGGAGDDYLSGHDGDDSLWGDAGNDHALGGAGADVLDGGDGNDMLWGDAGNDALIGGAGDDLLAGCEGDDHIIAGSGDDTVMGGGGDDDVSGGAGADVLGGGEGNDLVRGGLGADEVDGGAGDDTLWGGSEASDDEDVDFLNGGAGDDVLHLGAGDYGNGGAGADSFVLQDFAAGSPVAQITDFNPDEDGLVIYYDQAMHPDPQLSLQTGDGASVLLLDGVPLVSLANGVVPDLSTITLRAA
jgi:Ca2+-binding RTX toxin-like protein